MKSAQSKLLIAIAALGGGVFSISFAAIFIRFSEQELGPFATIAHRFWIASVALFLWQFFKARAEEKTFELFTIEFREIAWLGLAGLISGIDLALWALSLTQTSVANAAVLGNLSPIFTAVGSWIIWKKGFPLRYWIGLTIALGGACAIGLGDIQVQQWQGDVIAISSALLFSLYLLTLEQLSDKLSASSILLGCSSVAAVVTSAIALVMEPQFFPQTLMGWGAVVGLALLSQTLGHSLVTYSLQTLSAGLVAIAFLLEPVMAALMAWLLFHETLDLTNSIGFAVVILGVYLSLSTISQSEESPTGENI